MTLDWALELTLSLVTLTQGYLSDKVLTFWKLFSACFDFLNWQLNVSNHLVRWELNPRIKRIYI